MPDNLGSNHRHIVSGHLLGLVDGPEQYKEAVVVKDLHIFCFVLLEDVLQINFDNGAKQSFKGFIAAIAILNYSMLTISM